MANDIIHKMVEDDARRVCGDLWKTMNEKEQCNARLKSAITMIKMLSGGEK